MLALCHFNFCLKGTINVHTSQSHFSFPCCASRGLVVILPTLVRLVHEVSFLWMVVDIPLVLWHYCFVCLGSQSAIGNQCLRPCGFSEACSHGPGGRRPLWAVGTFTVLAPRMHQTRQSPSLGISHLSPSFSVINLEDALVAKRERNQLRGSKELESPWFFCKASFALILSGYT